MFKRKPEGRKIEAKKATKHEGYISSTSYDTVGTKLGINRAGRNYHKIKFELNRNKRNLKALGIDESVLKEFGL